MKKTANIVFIAMTVAGGIGWCFTHPLIALWIMGPGLIPYGYMQLPRKFQVYYLLTGGVAYAWAGFFGYLGVSSAMGGFNDNTGGGATAYAILLPFVTGGLAIGGGLLALLLHNWWWRDQGQSA